MVTPSWSIFLRKSIGRKSGLKVRLHSWARIRFKKRRDGKNKANPSPRDIRPMLFKGSKNLVNKTGNSRRQGHRVKAQLEHRWHESIVL